MKLHVSSFVFGCAVAATGAMLSPKLRPIVLDLATAGYRSLDRLAARLSIAREDAEDLLAEARARARSPGPPATIPFVQPS